MVLAYCYFFFAKLREMIRHEAHTHAKSKMSFTTRPVQPSACHVVIIWCAMPKKTPAQTAIIIMT